MSEAIQKPGIGDDVALSREQLKAIYDAQKAARSKIRRPKPTTHQIAVARVTRMGPLEAGVAPFGFTQPPWSQKIR